MDLVIDKEGTTYFIFAFRAIGVAYYWLVGGVNELGEECSIL